jgi:hypothetical protein
MHGVGLELLCTNAGKIDGGGSAHTGHHVLASYGFEGIGRDDTDASSLPSIFRGGVVVFVILYMVVV